MTATRMDGPEIRAHRRRNLFQTAVLLGGMTLMLGLLGWSLGGPVAVLWVAAAGLGAILAGARASAGLLLRLYQARPLHPETSPGLYGIAAELAGRAGLETPPLFLVPSRMMQAFTVGLRGGAAIAVTEGLLRGMTAREVAAVLAHEISHIAHRDIHLMTLADMMTKLTRLFAFAGLIILIVTLPLMLAGYVPLPWLAILLLVLAPSLSALMQLALSRTREFDADLGAVRLCGDPEALASALVRLERNQGRMWEQMVLPGYRLPEPSLLRTHPATEERVARLAALPRGAPLQSLARFERPAPTLPAAVLRPPRWRRSGLWY